MDKDENLSHEIWHSWVGRIKGLILIKAPQNAKPDESSKIDAFVVVFADCPGNATWLSLGQQWRYRQIITWNLRPPWARGCPSLHDGWPSSKHAGIGEDTGGPTLPGVDIIHVQPVQSAFKDELTIVIDDHGEAITIKAVVLEAVVFEV